MEETTLELTSNISDILKSITDKQDKLTFDNYPALNSNNPVKSSGLYELLKYRLHYGNTNYENAGRAYVAGNGTNKYIGITTSSAMYDVLLIYAIYGTTVTDVIFVEAHPSSKASSIATDEIAALKGPSYFSLVGRTPRTVWIQDGNPSSHIHAISLGGGAITYVQQATLPSFT